MQQRKSRTATRAIAALGACLLGAGVLLANPISSAPAYALDLPTWDEVQAAKSNQATADAKVKEIEKLIADGEKELDRLRNLHSSTLGDLKEAEDALTAASEKAQTLADQAAASQEEADAAAERAGVLVAQMYRSGGVDRSMELFLDADADTADALLERMASMSKATERNTKLSDEAEQASNNAASLGQQATAAEQEREVLRQDKVQKEQAAQAAVTDQGEVVRAQEAQQRDLEVKLEALKDTTAKTVAGYEERLRIEEEQRRIEAERQARLAREAEEARIRAEQEAQNNANNGGGGGGGSTPPVTPTDPGGGSGGGGSTPTDGGNGWLRPVSGYYISEGFMPPSRPNHTGIDLAAACWTPITAAASGTVQMSYWDNGGGGNMVNINHPNGWQTRYAHMIQWASVGAGQWVTAGETIGYVGSTGASTGCHLHFEMRPNQDSGWYGFVNPAFQMSL